MSLSLTASHASRLAEVSSLKLAGAEISAYHAASKILFVTSASSGLQRVDISNPSAPVLLGSIDFSLPPFGFSNGINSVAVSKTGVIAVAVESANRTDNGKVFLINPDGSLIKAIDVGAVPDMLTFTPDGKRLLVANEAEATLNSAVEQGATRVDPDGSVSIIDLSRGAADASVTTAGFTGFNSQYDALAAEGVRLFAGKTVAQDLEPEYIAVAPDGKTAMITLQEANAVAILDINKGRIVDIVPLGLKDWSGLQLDASDRDGGYKPLANLPVKGLYMPDAIASYQGAGKKTYFVTANEGDDRDDFIVGGEKVRVGSQTLDSALSPALKAADMLGRLNSPSATVAINGIKGDTNGDGDIDQILTYGGRSFSILDSKGRIVFDSGDHIERFIATQGTFSSGAPATSGAFDDSRSDDKGPEPEGVTLATVGDRTLAFIGLERGGGGVMVYDVTDPRAVSFVTYARNPDDVSPEGLSWISPENSPTGAGLLVATHEVSNTVTLFALTQLVQGSAKGERFSAANGQEEFTGAGGKDTFAFKTIGSALGDTITDFLSGTDRIDLRGIDADTTRNGNQKFDFVFGDSFSQQAGELLVTSGEDGITLRGDVGGDGIADFSITLSGVSTLKASDVLL